MSKKRKEKKSQKSEAETAEIQPKKPTNTVDFPTEPPAESETTEETMVSLEEKLQGELAQAQDQLLRARADFDNFRKRKAREMEQVRKTAAELLIRDILPAIDNLDLTLQHVEDPDSNLAVGVSMVFKQLMDTLSARGLSPIEALGKPFDPNHHEAMTQLPSDEIEKDHVMQEFQKGYMLHDTILRPTKVVVSSGALEAAPESDDQDKTEETAAAE